MLEDLVALLIRFRSNEIALLADIEKAFLQVGLQEGDRDVTRFLWIKDPRKSLSAENLIILRFTTVLFGIISSSFLLDGTLRLHLSTVGTEIAAKALEDLYVDNLVTGVANSEAAIQFYDEVKKIFHDISMNIRIK